MSSLNSRIKAKIKDTNFNEEMPFPKKNLLIEITNACNNKCIFCYNHCMKRKRKFIDESFCKRILNEAFELGCEEVGFYVTGEPLLNAKLDEYIEYAKNIGYKYIYLTTNGILATLPRVKQLYKKGLNSIKYSINSINKRDYKFIHGTDNYDRVMKNLTDVYNWKLENKIDMKLYVSYIATKYTYNKEKIKENFNNKCDEIVIMKAVNQGGLIPDIKEILDDKKMNIDIDNTFSLPCNYPFNSIVVTVEGYLTCCCMDFENFLAVADLNVVPLKEAWNNKYIKLLRKKHLMNDVESTICDNCIKCNKNIPKPIRDDLCNLTDYNVFCQHIKIFKEKNNESD